MQIEAIHLREIQMPLAHPFVTSFGVTTGRRIILAELEADGISGWGECVAGEHPYFSAESVDTAWPTLLAELAPRLLAGNVVHGEDCPALFAQVRGHLMAKAALENAVWDLDAQLQGVPLAQLLCGDQTPREQIACGVSIGMQPTLEQQLEVVQREVDAGYRRIKLKCKPGWDEHVFETVRERWPDILLSCDANSAYTLGDAERIADWDRFNLLMIEQPLWYDDFFFHSHLQKRMKTAICLDECIRNRRDAAAALELGSGRILNIKVGRVGGFTEALAVHDVAQAHNVPVWCGGMLESGIGRAHNIALSSLPNFQLPGDVSASKRYWAEDIIEPEVTVSNTGEIRVPTSAGRGFAVRRDRIDALTVRSESLRKNGRVSVAVA